MAERTDLTLGLGEDRLFVFSILNLAETAAIDISGWALSFMVKRHAQDGDARALVTKTTTAGQIVISGTYNADPDLNTQVATVTIEDTDTHTLVPSDSQHELKRTDAGFETTLSYGRISLVRRVHR